MRIAVFASGSGTNFQQIAEEVQAGRLDVSIELLVCDKPNAKVVERAQEAGVPTFTFRPKDYPDRASYEKEILEQLEARQVELVVLAGYMRILTDTLVKPYYGRMINIHPSLLPSFPGVDAPKQALEYGVKISGCTVHFVDGGMDTGPVIAQASVPVEDHDSVETLQAKIQIEERKLYPKVIGWIAKGAVKLDGRHVKLNKERI